MSGIEVVGLLLAIIPLIVPALDVYKDTLSGVKRFFHPVKDVQSLIHKLLLNQVELESLMKTTLVKASVDIALIPDHEEELAMVLLNDSVVQDTVRDYFGETNFALYDMSVQSCMQVVRNLAQSLSEFLPSSDNGDLVDFILKTKTKPIGRITIPQRFKIVLKKPDVDRNLEALEKSINGLRRLTKSIATNVETFGSSVSIRASKLAKKLGLAKRQAESLYAALSCSWQCNEHLDHEAGMILDGARTVMEQGQKKARKELDAGTPKFGMVLNAVTTPTETYWHHCEVKIMADEDEAPQQSHVLAGSGVPIITFDLTTTTSHDSTTASASAVTNLCLTARQAAKDKKLLNLYLLAQHEMRYNNSPTPTPYSPPGRAVTLHHILDKRQGHQIEMGYKDRVFLALNLAASLLRLQGTPWINNSWRTDRISFIEQENSPSPQFKVDLARPLLPHSFGSQRTRPSDGQPLEPREALLELGIMLLELWHHKSIQSFANEPMSNNYYDRLIVAMKWLDDVHNEPPVQYCDAIEKCLNGVRARKADWNDFAFRKELCADILEPLRICYEPFQR